VGIHRSCTGLEQGQERQDPQEQRAEQAVINIFTKWAVAHGWFPKNGPNTPAVQGTPKQREEELNIGLTLLRKQLQNNQPAGDDEQTDGDRLNEGEIAPIGAYEGLPGSGHEDEEPGATRYASPATPCPQP
jgi:hypothetical protein